eukprot:g32926.t1
MNKVGIKQFYNTKYDAKNPEFWKSIDLPNGPDKEYVCIGVKASNYFMPKETLSEKGPGGGGWILMNQNLSVKTRDGKLWGADEKGFPRIYAVGDCNYGCIEEAGKKPDDWPIPPIPKISYPGEEMCIVACTNIEKTDRLLFQSKTVDCCGDPLKVWDMHWPWGAGMFATSLGPDDACFVAGANWQKNSGLMCVWAPWAATTRRAVPMDGLQQLNEMRGSARRAELEGWLGSPLPFDDEILEYLLRFSKLVESEELSLLVADFCPSWPEGMQLALAASLSPQALRVPWHGAPGAKQILLEPAPQQEQRMFVTSTPLSSRSKGAESPKRESFGSIWQLKADEVKEARVAEEFEKLRQRNYKAISRCACHFNLLTALGLVHEAIQKPGCDTITWAFFCIMSYLQFLLIASERVELTPQRLKCLSFCMHLMKILLIISSAHSETTFRFAVLQSIAAAMRFCPVIVFLDPWMSIPFQVLYTAMEMSAHLLVFDQSSLELGPLCVSQFFTLTATISSSVFIHLVLRGRFEALLDTADAESLVSSFQRVLRGACDGEVLLDSQMNIAQESQCLKHLILTNVSLKGRSFQQLLVDEEQHRFLEFIHTSTQTLGTPESKDFLPLCLRVSFRGSAGIRVAADIYHVPVHLNFERIFRAEEEEGELRDDLVEGMQCGMPSLRKLVKPTEWEKIRSSVVRFAEKAALDPYLQPKVLKRMTVHLPAVWLPLHLAFTRSDFAELKQFSTFFLFPQAQDELKEARVDEEMIKLRQRRGTTNYKFVSRCVCHINLFTCLGLIHEAVRAPGLDTMTSLGLCTVCYVQYLIVGSGWVELTPLIMEVLSFVTHLLLIPVILSTCASASIFKFAVMQGLQVAMRFCPVVLFLDPWISIPFQVLYTATETSMYFFVFDRNTLELGPLCVSQFFILVSTVASSIFIDLLLRGRLYALFETADAESLVSSFRRVLRGACDGEVLLDGQMNVAQESECLKHLILTNVSLKGRSFQHLLVDEEQQRFHEFINTSTQAFGTPESKGSALPLCLRVSFRGSAGIQVGADIYHSSGIAIEEYCPELQEITMLVDVTTELQDVQQAHLNFERCADTGDLRLALQSSMPSLRKLVKPTDWEKIRSSVARFAEKALRDPDLQPKALRHMTVQLPGQSGWQIAEVATLHRIQGAQKAEKRQKSTSYRPKAEQSIQEIIREQVLLQEQLRPLAEGGEFEWRNHAPKSCPKDPYYQEDPVSGMDAVASAGIAGGVAGEALPTSQSHFNGGGSTRLDG